MLVYRRTILPFLCFKMPTVLLRKTNSLTRNEISRQKTNSMCPTLLTEEALMHHLQSLCLCMSVSLTQSPLFPPQLHPINILFV